MHFTLWILLAILAAARPLRAELKIAVFDADATPPPGSALTYDPMKEAGELSLRCRGICVTGAGDPVVLCAVDWIGVANEGHDFFRKALAEAAGTTPERVCVHALHQHDAPICDFSAERLLRERNLAPLVFDSAITKPAILRAAAALKSALTNARPLTHAGIGAAKVEQVASNRRILGPDGKVRAVRFTTTKDPALRAEPEGTIDPELSLVSLWSGETPVAILTYYATHPQSYYRTGIANPDFPGMARFLHQTAHPGALQIHFTGAGGNIGAGKYNDGSTENRPVLAARLADGMKRAWEAQKKSALTEADVGWNVRTVALPPAAHLNAQTLREQLAGGGTGGILGAAAQLAWVERCQAGKKLELACLRLGSARILHFPGELFVEYQLAAKRMAPDKFIAVAAYGDYAPGYIGTKIAYEEGGYETQPNSSFVTPEAEAILTAATAELLKE